MISTSIWAAPEEFPARDTAGAFKYNLPQTWILGTIDTLAARTRSVRMIRRHFIALMNSRLFAPGTSSMLATELGSVWSNTYISMLSSTIRALSKQLTSPIESIGDAFERMMDLANASSMVSGNTCTEEY
ncbi:hypothetical protein MBM_08492 [Drepanopeziza brunnea f. sp. 'multigermtubi' MB_m1]|uniref:Uncharacterized protein n=1 Tax=Marssonina brunnea f. sp. multigermtubi (strain MB_m1) TaxID=1072389 RepID=K1XLP8_MARBU|nr:uncharacterized protein MBM_08492 [Drepanopeziza brunnea f. sp. 'multigermtubi' MB_m1]EKD13409.1 hypothetical protein MBM_08492 [Drepanopeziza brunnea f. sp. 'multigermtubi' MB_m1]